MINKFINFFKNGFNTNAGYSTLDRIYYYDGKSYLGYVLVKNYTIFWINGYDRIAICSDKKELNETLERLKIKLR
jgi:hypothetical protein